MATTLSAYIIGLLVTASLLMAWFFTSGPIHLLHVLRKLGLKKNDTAFWHRLSPEWEVTWVDLEMFLANPANNIPGWLATLMQCRYCLSFHVSFWVALVTTILTQQSILFALGATFSWPVLANLIIHNFDNKA